MKLKEICEVFSDGDWIETKDQSRSGIRLVQTGNIGIGLFKDKADKARYISEATFKRLKCTEIFPGDLLVSRLPEPVGRACIIPEIRERMITAVDCTIIRPKKELVLAEYLRMFMMTYEYFKEVEEACTGTTRKRISRKKLGEISLHLPSIEEQRQIVARLDAAFKKIDKAIENIEKNLKDVRELFESEKSRNFIDNRWTRKKIMDVGKTFTGTTPKTVDKTNYGDYIPFVKPSDFKTDGSLNYAGQGLSKKGLDAGRLIKEGSVLMVCIGATIGKAGYCARDISCNQQINTVECKSLTEAKFLYYQISTKEFFNQVVKYAPQATMPILNKTKWNNLVVRVPSEDKQRLIVEKLDRLSEQVHKLQKLYQEKIDNLQAFKQSLLGEVFSLGEVE